MTLHPRLEKGPHVPMLDDWFAYPEISDEARATPITDAEYLYGRRSLMKGIVRSCDRFGIYITDEARAIADQTDKKLVADSKPDHVTTWADFREDFEVLVLQSMKRKRKSEK